MRGGAQACAGKKAGEVSARQNASMSIRTSIMCSRLNLVKMFALRNKKKKKNPKKERLIMQPAVAHSASAIASLLVTPLMVGGAAVAADAAAVPLQSLWAGRDKPLVLLLMRRFG